MLFYRVIGTFGIPGLSYSVISPTIAKWFIRYRGRATGIATAGLNLGAVALTPLILFLIRELAWRTAWFILGFVPWIVVVPPSLLWLRRQPEDMGLLPDGATRANSPDTAEQSETGGERRGAGRRGQLDGPSGPALSVLLVARCLRSAVRHVDRRPDHQQDTLRHGPRLFPRASGDLFRNLRHPRFRGQTGLGLSGGPLPDLATGHRRPDRHRHQHLRRRGLEERVAILRNLRGDVRAHRRVAGRDRSPSCGPRISVARTRERSEG